MEPEATTEQREAVPTALQPAQVQEDTPPLVSDGVPLAPVQENAPPLISGEVSAAPVQIQTRWFAERIAFILGGGLTIGIGVLAITGEPNGFVAPLALWAVYFMGSLCLGVGKMRREALTSEPAFSWALFFAEFLKFGGILLGLAIVGAIANLGKACSGN